MALNINPSEVKKLIVDDVDLYDPSSMDNILVKLDDINTEDEEFMQILVRNVAPRLIYWEQPWYQQTVSITRPVKDNSENLEYRMDAISSEEIERIEKNWRKFIKKYELPDKIICLARWRSSVRNNTSPEDKARHFAISFLARGLKRTLYHIFRFLIRHYACVTALKRYTKDEETILETLLFHQPTNAVVIASKILYREPRGVAKKIGEILNGKQLRPRLKWDLNLLTKFVKLLMEYSKIPTLDQLKYKTFDKSVWLRLEEQMNQNHIFLQMYWYTNLHAQLFVKRLVFLKKTRKQVFKKLKKSSYRIWSDIRWKQLVKEFPDGFTPSFLYKISHYAVKERKDKLFTPLQELVDYALKKIKQSVINKRLRTLAFNQEGKLEAVTYNL